MKYYLKHIDEDSAIRLADFFVLHKDQLPHILLLDGEVGTGKTTFSRAYITHGDTTVAFSSPTYTLVNEYNVQGRKMHHFDLYRITADDYDWIYEYLENEQAINLVEWAMLHCELFEEYQYVSLYFEYDTENTRNIRVGMNEKYASIMEEFLTNESIVFEKCNESVDCFVSRNC